MRTTIAYQIDKAGFKQGAQHWLNKQIKWNSNGL